MPAPGHCQDFTAVIQNTGVRYSMGKKIDGFQMRLNRLREIPGPGRYDANKSLTGDDAPGLVNSTKPRPTTVRFGSARDRFRVGKP